MVHGVAQLILQTGSLKSEFVIQGQPGKMAGIYD